MSILRSRNNQIFQTNNQVFLVNNQVFQNKIPRSHGVLLSDGFPRKKWGFGEGFYQNIDVAMFSDIDLTTNIYYG
jgi:hypothetical protein